MAKSNFRGFSNFKRIFGDVIERKGIIVQKELADTLEQIALAPDAIYMGELARDIMNTVRNASGSMTEDDLNNYRMYERTDNAAVADFGSLLLYYIIISVILCVCIFS